MTSGTSVQGLYEGSIGEKRSLDVHESRDNFNQFGLRSIV